MPVIERWTSDTEVIRRTARKPWECAGDGRATPNHAPTCTAIITPGSPYVEYLGEATAYASGSRHSLDCARHFGYVDG